MNEMETPHRSSLLNYCLQNYYGQQPTLMFQVFCVFVLLFSSHLIAYFYTKTFIYNKNNIYISCLRNAFVSQMGNYSHQGVWTELFFKTLLYKLKSYNGIERHMRQFFKLHYFTQLIRELNNKINEQNPQQI